MIAWLTENWLKILIPALTFIATIIVGLWLRRVLNDAFERWRARTKWSGSILVKKLVYRLLPLWFLLLGISIAVIVSVLPAEAKNITFRVSGSLFVLSLVWAVIVLSERLLKVYLPRMKMTLPAIVLITNIIRIIFVVVGALIILDIWGVPTTPLLLLILVIILGGALALRNAAPDLFAGLQLSATQHIKIGDYIKLETGEEGYVADINWNTTHIKTLTESITLVPNRRLLGGTVINYGHPLKKAKEPFHFFSRVHTTELTGFGARNLREFADTLRMVPDAVVYYHTHRFLEQHHYLTPEPSNDFATWVSDALGEEVLGEKLASVDIFEFPNLSTLKERIIGMIEEYLATNPGLREAQYGEEFYFMKSVSVVFPTSYVVTDLREFVETLRKISIGSLYFHIFESRLRLGRGFNDFSVWMRDSLEEPELAVQISRLDPYTYTLEGLRLALIQLIEKHIK